jgi:hypothetical protein
VLALRLRLGASREGTAEGLRALQEPWIERTPGHHQAGPETEGTVMESGTDGSIGCVGWAASIAIIGSALAGVVVAWKYSIVVGFVGAGVSIAVIGNAVILLGFWLRPKPKGGR